MTIIPTLEPIILRYDTINRVDFHISPLLFHNVLSSTVLTLKLNLKKTIEGKEKHYVTKSDRTLQQLSTRIQGQKRMIVKYINGVKYIQIFDNEKGAKYPGIVLKYDEYNETWSDFLLMEKGEHFFNNVSI